MHEIPEQDRLAKRIAGPLQIPERADASLVTRVMSGVRADSLGLAVPWWRRSVTLHVSPLATLALVAGLGAIVVVGVNLRTPLDRAFRPPHAIAARRDTVRIVRFVLAAPGVSSVALVGDFNRWDVNAHRLVPAGAAGIWSTTVPLTRGRHEYAFVIDGTRWVADPAAAASIADEFGGESSVITVGDATPPHSG